MTQKRKASALTCLLFSAAGGTALPLRAQTVWAGAVPGNDTPASVSLTLADCIRLGLRNNLGTLLADESTQEARARRVAALAQLMPNVTGRVQQSSTQVNLAAFGFAGFPGVSRIVGPFSVFDMRASVTQPVLNLRSLNGARATAETVRATGIEYQDARDTVAAVVAALYLDALAGAGRITSAEARVATAQALFDQAREFKASGVVPGIDVLRAEVQLSAQRQRLISLQSDSEIRKLHLARAIGLRANTALRLADPMPTGESGSLPSIDEAVGLALNSRMDYRSLEARAKAAQYRLKAATAGRMPSVNLNGDYGIIGKRPDNSHGTFTAAISLSVPLFDGNRVKAEEQEVASELARLHDQVAELRGRIEFEIREAHLNLRAAAEQLTVARGAHDLARLQEEQARDRFAAGVTSNLEVVQAQESVAATDENLISSLLAGNLAKASLARAIGSSEKYILTFLAGGGK